MEVTAVVVMAAVALATSVLHLIYVRKKLQEAKFIITPKGEDKAYYDGLMANIQTKDMVKRDLHRTAPIFIGTLLLAALWLVMVFAFNVDSRSDLARLTMPIPMIGTVACLFVTQYFVRMFEEARVRNKRGVARSN